ncbi:DUF1579 domain-containing protein [Flavobacterium alkalisoli]|uniref:DUF1579 domain-containing protein n=1 Tax=Flavobacterium alkalisoli TaxID=2602769 RepID=A0A5B9FSY4_9FLAO|nr:DUF1579 domain-containing protein [Flavobacterium alkalisoli]QEE50065.1 DUF1579 domain-containing protein [Flavobacterium alkalisoli]
MKKIYVTLSAVALCLTSCKKEEKMDNGDAVMNDTVTTEEPAPKMAMDSAAMAQAWQAYMTPGDMHKLMTDEEGKWNCDMTFWMGPDAPAEKQTAGCEIEMILGGRYQKSTYSGDMMGMPFEGIATLAFDNASNEFTSTWIDNMGTGMMVLKGTYNGNTRTTTLEGSAVDPATKQPKKIREIYEIVDENTRKMQMFETPKGGSEYKSMELVMTRK